SPASASGLRAITPPRASVPSQVIIARCDAVLMRRGYRTRLGTDFPIFPMRDGWGKWGSPSPRGLGTDFPIFAMSLVSRHRRGGSALCEARVFRAVDGLDLDAVLAEVADAVLAGVAGLDDQDARDAGVVDHLRAHHARLAGDDQPRAAARDAV